MYAHFIAFSFKFSETETVSKGVDDKWRHRSAAYKRAVRHGSAPLTSSKNQLQGTEIAQDIKEISLITEAVIRFTFLPPSWPI